MLSCMLMLSCLVGDTVVEFDTDGSIVIYFWQGTNVTFIKVNAFNCRLHLYLHLHWICRGSGEEGIGKGRRCVSSSKWIASS
mmetsp:Transcript_3716/g.4017  ORF Transcript_3716/g.4017 Transcript_3716/m.4017 type:complete len:82 (-) Transcript_3716:140-385(-)